MAATRPVWRGQLRLSLVSIAVEMFPAQKSTAKPSFRQIHEPSGKPVNYEKVVKGLGPIDTADIRKGFEYEKGEFVLLSDDEIDAVRLETRKTIELTQFVDKEEIPPTYFDAPYFLTPADELAEDAFRVIRDALKLSNKVGLGQLALRGREHLVAVQPIGKGLMLETLHYADEVRKPDTFFTEILGEQADEELLAIANQLIEKKTAPFDPAAFQDHYQTALRELIDTKLKSKGGRASVQPEPAAQTGSNVVDLMAALKKSLEGSEEGKSKKAAATKQSAANDAESKPRPKTRTAASSTSAKPPSSRKRAS